MDGRRVLVVDDDPSISNLIAKMLRDSGLEIRAVNDPDRFEKTYREFGPDLILLDLNMHDLDGIELLRVLSRERSTVPIILVSGEDSRVVSTAQRFGRTLGLCMMGVLAKPFNMATLKGEMEKHIRRPRRRPRRQEEVDEFDLVDWILQGELVNHYQPKVCLRTGRVAGVEVLARLRHPTIGLLSPDRFIPFAESRGMIAGLTERIFDEALQHPALHHPACRDLNVAFNLSPLLLEDLQLPDRLESRLGEIGFQPERLVLEVTEACTQKDQIASMDVLARLRLKGFQLSIDDFGTGFSSLLHLYRLPFGELKIDKSFVSEARSSDEAATIVGSTVGLAHSLGLKVVAEGIENWATLDWLKDLRCDQGQGYHMSPPVDGDRLVEWLDEWHGFTRPGIGPM